MDRYGPGILSGDGSDRYYRWRMSMIRETEDHTTAMRMLADLAMWNAVTQTRRRAYQRPTVVR